MAYNPKHSSAVISESGREDSNKQPPLQRQQSTAGEKQVSILRQQRDNFKKRWENSEEKVKKLEDEMSRMKKPAAETTFLSGFLPKFGGCTSCAEKDNKIDKLKTDIAQLSTSIHDDSRRRQGDIGSRISSEGRMQMSETFLSHTLPETARKLEGETFSFGQGDVPLTSRQYLCWFFQRVYDTTHKHLMEEMDRQIFLHGDRDRQEANKAWFLQGYALLLSACEFTGDCPPTLKKQIEDSMKKEIKKSMENDILSGYLSEAMKTTWEMVTAILPIISSCRAKRYDEYDEDVHQMTKATPGSGTNLFYSAPALHICFIPKAYKKAMVSSEAQVSPYESSVEPSDGEGAHGGNRPTLQENSSYTITEQQLSSTTTTLSMKDTQDSKRLDGVASVQAHPRPGRTEFDASEGVRDLQMRLQNITIKDHDIFGKCGVNLPKKLSQKQPTAWDIVEQITTQKKSTNHFEATNILQKAVKKPKDKDSIKVALEECSQFMTSSATAALAGGASSQAYSKPEWTQRGAGEGVKGVASVQAHPRPGRTEFDASEGIRDLQMRLQNITIKDHDIFGKCGVNLPKKLSQKQPTAWDIVEQITTQKKSTNHFEATNILQKAVKKPKDKDSIKVALEECSQFMTLSATAALAGGASSQAYSKPEWTQRGAGEGVKATDMRARQTIIYDKELQAIVIEDYETQTLANNLQISLAFRRTNALEIMRVMRNTHINYEEQQLLTGLSVALKNQGIYNRTQHIDNILQIYHGMSPGTR